MPIERGRKKQKNLKGEEASEDIPYSSEDKKKRKSRQSFYCSILPNILHQIFFLINKKYKSLKCEQKINSSLPVEQQSKCTGSTSTKS